ncbi:MAG: hypothetical protein IJW64_01200 [Clostridia bacterium]|nr:hypothetical protein [Clostridia bacterium]
MDEIIREEETSFFSAKAIIKELKRHLLKIFAVIVAFAILGGAYGLFFADVTYKTEASVIAFDDDVYADETEEITVIQSIASSARAMIMSTSGNLVFEKAVETLEEKGIKGLTIEAIKECLTVTNTSMFVNFTYETSSVNAQVILDTIVSEFLSVLNEKHDNGKYVMTMFGGKLKTFTSASEIKEDKFGSAISSAILFGAVGAVLSVGLVVVLALLRQTFLDKESVEKELGIEVLAVVEELKEEKGGR